MRRVQRLFLPRAKALPRVICHELTLSLVPSYNICYVNGHPNSTDIVMPIKSLQVRQYTVLVGMYSNFVLNPTPKYNHIFHQILACCYVVNNSYVLIYISSICCLYTRAQTSTYTFT